LHAPPRQVTKYVEAEIVNHSLMRHPHVIQFKEVFLSHRFICIAMEYATGGSLFQYVQRQGRLKEAVARWFFQQLVVGVDYCHRKGVANRDIKLENTLLQVGGGATRPALAA
jgi:serine/threonine-protein kinase SRK2